METVILDEVHAVAGTKRGAHLALTLERLDALLDKPAQRVGLSATVEPVTEVARYLAGGRPVEIVQPPSTKEWDLDVVVPIADMSALGEVIEATCPGPPSGAERRASIWPHVEERIVDLVVVAPLDAGLRQLPPPRRAPHRPAQRDLGRAARDDARGAGDEPAGRPGRPATAPRPS